MTQKPKLDIMIDLETLGTNPDSVILSLGAVIFDLKSKSLGATFHHAIDINSQLELGRRINGDTIYWWMKQSKEAKELFNKKAFKLERVLRDFTYWINFNCREQEVVVWGNGSNFDISMLEDAYKDIGEKIPWKYRNVNDLRTFKRFFAPSKKIEVDGIAHSALDDARSQAKFVLENYDV